MSDGEPTASVWLFPHFRRKFLSSASLCEPNSTRASVQGGPPDMGDHNLQRPNLRTLDLKALPKDDGPPSETQLRRQKYQFFEKQCSEVASGLFLSGDWVARNRELLHNHGITHVVNCVGFVCQEYFKGELDYKTYFLQDTPAEDILCVLYDVFEYIDTALSSGGRVLVHCSQGVSRSASLVIAYLMWREKASYDDIFARVKAIRGVANPNIGFTCQLLQWQKRRNAPPARTRMYRIASHSQHAPLLLVPRTVTPPKKYATHTWRELDPRGAFIIQTPTRLYVWQGSQCPDSHGAAARAAARLLPKYETPGCSEISVFYQGRESEEFIALMDPPALDPDAERQNARRASITGELVGALSFGPLSNGASAAATPNETTGPPLLPHSTSLGPHGGSRLGSMSRAMPDSGVATQPCADEGLGLGDPNPNPNPTQPCADEGLGLGLGDPNPYPNPTPNPNPTQPCADAAAAATAGCDVHMAVSQPFTEGAEKSTAAEVQGCGAAAPQLPPGVKARQRSQGCSTDWSHEDGGEQAVAMDQDQPGRQEHLAAGCQTRQQQPMELEGAMQPGLPGPHPRWYAQEVDDYSPDFQLWAGAMRVASASTTSGLLLGVFGSDSFLDVLPVLPLASRSLLTASPTPDRTISALYTDLPSTAPPGPSATLLRTSGSSGAAALAADWGTGRTDGRLSLAGDTRHEGGVHGAMAKEVHGCMPHAPCPHSLSSPMQPALEMLLLDQPALPLSAQHQGPSFGSPLRSSQWPAAGTGPGSPFLAPFQGQPLPDSPATLEGRSRKMSKRGMVLDKPMRSHSRLAESLPSQDLI